MKLKNIKLRTLIFCLMMLSLVILMLVQVVYYAQFSYLTRARAQSFSNAIINQVSGQLEIIAKNIQNSAEMISFNMHVQEFITTDDMVKKYIRIHPFVNDYLQQTKSSNVYIKDVLLIDLEGKLLTSVRAFEFDIIDLLKTEYGFDPQTINEPFFTSAMLSEGVYYQAYVYPIISAMQRSSLFERIGYCVILMRTDVLQQLVTDISFAPNSHFVISDRSGMIIASNMPEDIGKSYDGRIVLGIAENDLIEKSKEAASGLWRIQSYMSRKDLTSDMAPIVNTGMVICTAMGILLLLIWMLFSSSISKSILTLVTYLRSMGDTGEMKARAPVEGENEIGMIAESVNMMLDKIDTMNQQVLQAQSKYYDVVISQKQSELSMLQSQINPHFLYNTLNCVSSIGLVNGVDEIVTIASAMSKIFRYSIKEASMVTVSQEVECVKEYLKIMNIRHLNKFEFTIEIDPELNDCMFPKMVLQPIVENALNHGLEDKSGNGCLHLCGAMADNGVATFSVTDNGKGMSQKRLEELTAVMEGEGDPAHRPMGLANINKRLNILYGQEYGVHVSSKNGEGTRVSIDIPVNLGTNVQFGQ